MLMGSTVASSLHIVFLGLAVCVSLTSDSISSIDEPSSQRLYRDESSLYVRFKLPKLCGDQLVKGGCRCDHTDLGIKMETSWDSGIVLLETIMIHMMVLIGSIWNSGA